MADWISKLRQFREATVVIDDLDVVLQVLGFTPARFAALVSVLIAAVLTWDQGIAVGIFAMFMVFPALVYGLIGIRELRERMLQLPDFTRWSKVQIMPIWQAASLWADRNPSPVITPSSSIYPYLQQLKGAVEVGELKTTDGEGNMKALVKRDELIRYAESVKEKPQFLYPGDIE